MKDGASPSSPPSLSGHVCWNRAIAEKVERLNNDIKSHADGSTQIQATVAAIIAKVGPLIKKTALGDIKTGLQDTATKRRKLRKFF